MIAGASWQDLTAAFAALIAGAWLFRRWQLKRRARTGCDQCAAAAHGALSRRATGTKAESSQG